MADKNLVNFKVFLQSKEAPDIRRFTVDLSVATSFMYMTEKLKVVFPNLGQDFKVTWLDKDGDAITIANDEDLETAIMETDKGVQSLYVTPVQPKVVPPEYYVFPKVHTGYLPAPMLGGPVIICDVCDKSITGLRFKCLQCADYDLCAYCEHRGNHVEHIMLRIPINDTYNSKYARKFLHHVTRNLKKSAHVAGKEAHRAAKCAARFGHAATRASAQEENKNEDATEPGCSNMNNESSQQAPKCPFMTEEDVPIPDMHALGAMARQHLAPLFETLQTSQPVGQSPNDNEGNVFEAIRNVIEGFFGPMQEQQQQQQQQQKQAKEQQPAENAASSAADKIPTPMDVESVAHEEQPPNTNEIPFNGPPQAHANIRRDPGWTYVAALANPVPPSNSGVAEAQPSVTAPLFVEHENPKIAEGLVRLYEMGFSNETGLLSRLLESCDGDVSATVKIIIGDNK